MRIRRNKNKKNLANAAESLLSKKEDNAMGNSAPPVVENTLNSPSKSLDEETLSVMNSKFGKDFSDVKVHDDELAAESADTVNARAYTSGKDIVFNKDEYNTNTDAGKKLLAHELTHVVQQTADTNVQSTVQRDLGDDSDTPGFRTGTFFTPDSLGPIRGDGDPVLKLDIHIDYLPSHTLLNVFISTEKGGSYQSGMPIQIIGNPGHGGDYVVTLSPVPEVYYIRFEARSQETDINVPNIRGTCSLNLD